MITFKKIDSVKVVKNESNYVYCIEVEKNHNFNANGINLKNCCRLKNELSTVGKDGKQEYVNSFGVGGISIRFPSRGISFPPTDRIYCQVF